VKKLVRLILPSAVTKYVDFYISGTWPIFRAEKKLVNGNRELPPITISEKIRYKMAFDRRSTLSLFADKVLVRDFVLSRVGKDYLTEAYSILDPNEVDSFSPLMLPQNYVVKVNHGSGGVIVVAEVANKIDRLPADLKSINWGRYLIHPNNLDWILCKQILTRWLVSNYYYQPGSFPEWAYRNIRPKVLIEEFLQHNGGIPDDYKFFMVSGKCVLIQVDSSRYSSHKRDLYSPNWVLLDAEFIFPTSGSKVERPSNLEEMIEIAEKLSAGMDFVRVDLYCTDNGIKFGELTNYPDAGKGDIFPRDLSIALARNWIQDY